MSKTKRIRLDIEMKGSVNSPDFDLSIDTDGDSFTLEQWLTLLLFMAGRVIDKSLMKALTVQNDQHRILIESTGASNTEGSLHN